LRIVKKAPLVSVKVSGSVSVW